MKTEYDEPEVKKNYTPPRELYGKNKKPTHKLMIEKAFLKLFGRLVVHLLGKLLNQKRQRYESAKRKPENIVSVNLQLPQVRLMGLIVFVDDLKLWNDT